MDAGELVNLLLHPEDSGSAIVGQMTEQPQPFERGAFTVEALG